MSNKKTAKPVSARVLAVVPEVAAPDFDLRVDISDLKSIASTQLRTALTGARTVAKQKYESTKKAHAIAVQKRDDAVAAIAKEIGKREGQPLADQVNQWLGRNYAVVSIESPALSGLRVTFTADIERSANLPHDYSSTYLNLSRKFDVEAPSEILELQLAVNAAKEDEETAKTACEQVNHAIVNIPHMTDMVHSQLTIAKLGGQIKTGSDVMHVIQDTLQNGEVRRLLANVVDGPLMLTDAGMTA